MIDGVSWASIWRKEVSAERPQPKSGENDQRTSEAEAYKVLFDLTETETGQPSSQVNSNERRPERNLKTDDRDIEDQKTGKSGRERQILEKIYKFMVDLGGS
jgi:hypothetical protein